LELLLLLLHLLVLGQVLFDQLQLLHHLQLQKTNLHFHLDYLEEELLEEYYLILQYHTDCFHLHHQILLIHQLYNLEGLNYHRLHRLQMLLLKKLNRYQHHHENTQE